MEWRMVVILIPRCGALTSTDDLDHEHVGKGRTYSVLCSS